MTLNIASCIDHTILKESTTIFDIDQVCSEAISEQFAAVCIPSKFIIEAKKKVQGTGVKVATVISFPFGDSHWSLKVFEINEAIAKGADELDMVINLNALKSGNMDYLDQEIRACLEPVKSAGKIIKLIVESGILTDSELVNCCKFYSNYKIDYMKTSTGVAKVGATIGAVKTMRSNLPWSIKIKASGGIKNYLFARDLIEAGANRLGCSASMQIMKEYREWNKTVL